jgi:hypothetical protein
VQGCDMGCFIVQILANADSSAIRGCLARGMFARACMFAHVKL